MGSSLAKERHDRSCWPRWDEESTSARGMVCPVTRVLATRNGAELHGPARGPPQGELALG